MKIIRLNQVIDATGLGRSTIYKYISEGKFPLSLQISERCVGWVESEIEQWIQTRIEMRDAPNSGATIIPQSNGSTQM